MGWVDSAHRKTTAVPRIAPGGRRDIGIGASALSAAAGRLIGARSVHAIGTFAHNSRMFWGWLAFWVRMMALARLPRADGELVILRTARNVGNRYEWTHHVVASRLGRLSVDDVERVAEGPKAAGWSPRQRAILQAVDDLCADREIGDATWAAVREHLDEAQTVELCFLPRNYAMLAMTLNNFGVQFEDGAYAGGPLAFLARGRLPE